MLMAEKQGVAAGVQSIRLEPNAQRQSRFRTLEEAQAALIGFYGSLGYTAERSGWMSKRVGGI
jgi:hypothetical protein